MNKVEYVHEQGVYIMNVNVNENEYSVYVYKQNMYINRVCR